MRVIELFYAIDDCCQTYSPYWQQHLLVQDGRRRLSIASSKENGCAEFFAPVKACALGCHPPHERPWITYCRHCLA